MNILKIKLTFNILILSTFLFVNLSIAQNVTIASNNSFRTNINIKGSSGLELGYLEGKKSGTKYFLQLKDRNEKSILSSTLGVSTSLGVDGKTVLFADNKGRVVIGDDAWNLRKVSSNGAFISENDYKLFVENGIITEKCKVAVKSTNDWADYVFEEDYERMSLNELEDFVTENKHLPKVPSAEEMVENGLDVAKMDAKLLEKIEEAYLYIIDLNNKVDALANENESLKTSLQSLSTSGN